MLQANFRLVTKKIKDMNKVNACFVHTMVRKGNKQLQFTQVTSVNESKQTMRCLVASTSNGFNFAINAYGRAPIEKFKVSGTITPRSSNPQRPFTAVFGLGFE